MLDFLAPQMQRRPSSPRRAKQCWRQMHVEFKRQMCAHEGCHLFEGPGQPAPDDDLVGGNAGLVARQRIWTSVFHDEQELQEKDARHMRWVESIGSRVEDLHKDAASSIIYVDAAGLHFGMGPGLPAFPDVPVQFPVTLTVTWLLPEPAVEDARAAPRSRSPIRSAGRDSKARTYRCAECATRWVSETADRPTLFPNGFCSLAGDGL